MSEFGDLKDRTVIEKSFQSEVEGIEDGFYVFISYQAEYKNTRNHVERLILKQNDQAKWKIIGFDYEFQNGVSIGGVLEAPDESPVIIKNK